MTVRKSLRDFVQRGAAAQRAVNEIIGKAKRTCRVCGCTDDDCRGCIERTGEPCHWVASDLCSAYAEPEAA